MVNMRWFLFVCVVFAVTNIATSRPQKEEEPNYDDDVLNDDDGGIYTGEDDGDEDDENDTDDEAGHDPIMNTKPLTIKATEGSTIYLPCNTEYAESYSVMWKMNGIMIYQDKIQVGQRNERYKRFPNQTLQIERLGALDAGKYECSISTSPNLTKVQHELIVLTPPRIAAITANSKTTDVTVERGRMLELECVAVGNPTPKVSWSKDGHRVSAEHSEFGTSRVVKQNVGREDGGLYVCMADNEVSKEPIISGINIDVKHKPDMKIEKVIVGETEMHLICKVHANPKANVTWTRNNKMIKENENIMIEHLKHDHEHIVKIHKLEESDFGNYTCHARNSFGDARKQITVTGTPVTPKLENHRFVGDNDELKTEWVIMSMIPITAIQLQYRKQGEGKIWNTEIPETTKSKSYVHNLEHTLKHLQDGVYEVRVRAENKYGWSDYSRIVTLEGKPKDVPDSISEIEGIPYTIDDSAKEPISSTNAGTRSVFCWSSVILVIVMRMNSWFV